jgi:hypothetical protein
MTGRANCVGRANEWACLTEDELKLVTASKRTGPALGASREFPAVVLENIDGESGRHSLVRMGASKLLSLHR